jgi:CRP/FNR family transcriptional regulator, cyclic AMP receptor protein
MLLLSAQRWEKKMLFQRHSDKADALNNVPLFGDLSKRDLERVARIADEIDSMPGEVLIRQGELAREFFLIARGGVKIERDGKVIAHRGEGEVLGELALIDGKPRTATVITEKPSTLLLIEWQRFWPLLESQPTVKTKLLVGVTRRLREVQDSLSY